MDEGRRRLLAGLPVTERRLRVSGVTTVVLEAGTGPPMVLLHGGIECGAVYWAPVVARLAETHRLVMPDAPGLGESAPVPALGPIPFNAWLSELLRLTCERRPVLVAHSLLGSLSARFALAHGELLRGLVLYGAPAIGPYRLPAGLLMTAILFGLKPSQRNLDRFIRWALHDPEEARARDPEWFDAFRGYLLARARVPHVKRTMRYLIGTATKPIPIADLRRIDVPTALLCGKDDRMVPISVARAATAGLGWPLHLIDAGHAAHVEHPDRFLAALRCAIGDPRTEAA